MTKVVLVETHPLMRLGLHQMLGALPGSWDIVALDTYAVKEFAHLECPVDLVIFGFPANLDEGWEALAQTARLLQPQRILLLCDPSAPWQPPPGEGVPNVYGCITKTAPIEVLEAAIRLGLAGGECFPNQGMTVVSHASVSSLPARLNGSMMDGTGAGYRPVASAEARIQVTLAPELADDDAAADAVAAASLPIANGGMAMNVTEGAQLLNVTPRQYEVLTLLAKGYPIKTVSRMLNISTATAKAHASTLYQRLRVNSKGEAVYAARQRGARFD